MLWVQAALLFVFSVSNDWLSVSWHDARENNKPLKGALVGAILGLIAWLSIVWVVADNRWLMVPDILGTAVGSYLGIKLYHEPLKVTPAGIILKMAKGFQETKD